MRVLMRILSVSGGRSFVSSIKQVQPGHVGPKAIGEPYSVERKKR